MTIFSGGLAAKRLGLLRDLVPQAKIVAVLINSDWPAAVRFQTDVEEAAHVVGLSIQILRANNESEIDDAFNGLAQTQAGALLVGPGPFFDSRRDKLIALAAKAGVPAACESRATATLQRPCNGFVIKTWHPMSTYLTGARRSTSRVSANCTTSPMAASTPNVHRSSQCTCPRCAAEYCGP